MECFSAILELEILFSSLCIATMPQRHILSCRPISHQLSFVVEFYAGINKVHRRGRMHRKETRRTLVDDTVREESTDDDLRHAWISSRVPPRTRSASSSRISNRFGCSHTETEVCRFICASMLQRNESSAAKYYIMERPLVINSLLFSIFLGIHSERTRLVSFNRKYFWSRFFLNRTNFFEEILHNGKQFYSCKQVNFNLKSIEK